MLQRRQSDAAGSGQEETVGGGAGEEGAGGGEGVGAGRHTHTLTPTHTRGAPPEIDAGLLKYWKVRHTLFLKSLKSPLFI